MKNLERTDKLTAWKKGSLQSTMKKTESRLGAKTYDANRVSECWDDCRAARERWEDALTKWEEPQREIQEPEKMWLTLPKQQK